MAHCEIRVRPVTRYIVTKYTEEGETCSSIGCGEFSNTATANMVAHALAEAERREDKFAVIFKPLERESGEPI